MEAKEFIEYAESRKVLPADVAVDIVLGLSDWADVISIQDADFGTDTIDYDVLFRVIDGDDYYKDAAGNDRIFAILVQRYESEDFAATLFSVSHAAIEVTDQCYN